jgi:hypothetical protein
MDFESEVVNNDVQFQTEIDNTGKSQLPPTTWATQAKRAYNQSKLLDYWGSERNANAEAWDGLIGQISEEQEPNIHNRQLMHNYGVNTDQQEKLAIEQTYQNGDWSIVDGEVVTSTPKGADMLSSIFGSNTDKIKGYVLSLPYEHMTPKAINSTVTEQTRDEYKRLGGLLEQDAWYEEFGSQFLGGAGAYLTDPIGVATLAAEIGVLSKFRVIKGALDLSRTTKKVRGVEALVTSGKSADEVASFIAKSKKGFGREELMALGMSEAAVGSLSEALQQYLSYDFKSTVLPEYGGEQVSQAVGTVAGISMFIPIAGKAIGDRIVHGQMQKQMDNGKKADEEVETFFEKEAEVETEPTQTEKDIETAPTLDEADVKKEEAFNALDDLLDCFLKEK